MSCVAIGMSNQSMATVVVLFEEIDLGGGATDVKATWTGQLELGDEVGNRAQASTLLYADQRGIAALTTGVTYSIYVGGSTNTGLTYGTGAFTSTGDLSLGFYDSEVYYDGDVVAEIDFDVNPYSVTILGESLASLNAESFNDTLAYTMRSGDTISYTTVSSVPEPSSTFLVSLGAIGCVLRRRR